LLIDYEDSMRSDILDMLFLPQFGLSLHIIKVEIGGDTNSGDGSEPSHSHSRGDLSCTRGYEVFMLREAKRRNPSIKTYGLSWGAPAYINNGSFFGPEMVQYQTQWVACMAAQNLSIDYLGAWNERFWGGAGYVKALRAGLDAAGFSSTEIILPDGLFDASIMASAASDAAFNASFSGIGLHYPCDAGAGHPEVDAGGKLFWASEDWWDQPDWVGAQTWGHLLSYNFVVSNLTTTIAWSPLWAVYYPQLIYEEAGLIRAREPWSGHWDVTPPVWTGAQWNQFTTPGWQFLTVGSGSSGFLPGGGTYVSLVPPSDVGLTLILETFSQPARCKPKSPIAPLQSVTFLLTGGTLPPPGAPLFVWTTNETHAFVAGPPVAVSPQGTLSVDIPVDTMVTITTVSGGRKGAPPAPPPPSAPFPLPYADAFSGYAEDATPRFLADQYGTWAVRGGALVQVVPADPGPNAWWKNAEPLTVLGDPSWFNVTVGATATLPPPTAAAAAAAEPGPANGAPAALAPCAPGDPLQVWAPNAPAGGYLSNAAAVQCLASLGCKSALVYWECVTTGGTCCGAACYKNLQWALPPAGGAAGQVVSTLPGGGCAAAAAGAGGALALAPCVPPSDARAANQSWTLSAGGALELEGTGFCLSAPAPPAPYASVCGSITQINSQKGGEMDGLCCWVDAGGRWALAAGGGAAAGRPLARGVLKGPPAGPTRLEARFSGAKVDCAVGGEVVGGAEVQGRRGGLVALGSSWTEGVHFTDFSVGQTE
jgi:hypothetical protein